MANPRIISIFNLSLVVILIIIGFGVYGNSLGNSFVWDDELLVTGNLSIRSLSNIPGLFNTDLAPEVGGNFFRPLQAISYTIDYTCWGLNPFGYHLTSILIHIANSLLVFFLISFFIKLRGSKHSLNPGPYAPSRFAGMDSDIVAAVVDRGTYQPRSTTAATVSPICRMFPRAVPFLTAVLFLVHPVQTESVAYIAGRADLLAAFFMLLALLFSLDGRKIFRLLLSMVFFLLALSAKEAAIILPLLIILCHITLRKMTGRANNERLSPAGWYYAALFMIALIYAMARYFIIQSGNASLSSNPYSFYERFLTGSEVILLYLKVLIFPVHLRMERVIYPVTVLFSSGVIYAAIILSGVVIGAVRAYRRSPIIFFGIVWFFCALLPYMNWFPLNAEMAEHWLYLPSIGFVLLFAIFAETIITRGREAKTFRTGLSLLIAVIVTLSALTIRRNLDWSDNKAIYLATARHSPESPRAHYNLGNIYLAEGRLTDAVREFTESIRIKDWDPKSHSNLGKALIGLNRIPEAVREFETAAALEPSSPQGLIKLGAAYGMVGRLDEAVRVLLKAITLDPAQPDAYNNLGSVYTRLKRYDEAELAYRASLRLNQGMVEAIFNLGV
ncbi:MAG TPA: tetratricopeptide repeat protein, partial [Proteobacteria bacterium]|nr:tetratricopeptide repeat protein [Pseudomonadota bacterium]